MKITEKIFLGLIVVQAFFLVLIDFDGYGSVMFFYILLGLFYLVGSYWLFKPRGAWKVALSLFTGLALACAFLALYYFTRVIYTTQVHLFAVPNAALALGTGVYLLVAKLRKTQNRFLAAVFIRSAPLVLITAVFAFTPVSVKAFRKVLIAFNKHDFERYNNLLMFDFGEKYQEATDADDCEQAIKFALESNNAGKRWLLFPKSEYTPVELYSLISDSLEFKPEGSECLRIGQTYENVYYAYKCRAQKEFNEKNYTEALESFKTGHSYLTECYLNKANERNEVSWSFYNMAICLRKLERYDTADSFFLAALDNYRPVKDWPGLAEYISSYGVVVGKEGQYHEANHYLKAANAYLQKESLTPETKAALSENYLEIAKNYMQQDSLAIALESIKSAVQLSDKEPEKFCRAGLYFAMCTYKLNNFEQADSAAQKTLACYQNQPDPNSQNIAAAHLLLCYTNTILARYALAESHVNEALQITEKNYGTNHVRYANLLCAWANLKHATGHYTNAEDLFGKAIAIYGNNPDEVAQKAEALSNLAFTELTLSKFGQADAHSDTSLAILNRQLNSESPSVSGMLNTAANIDYFLGNYTQAERLHKRVIAVNRKFGLTTEAEIATALNGLGLIETARRKYTKADSLFLASISIYKAVLTENHPLTANAYLNHSLLMIKQNRLTEAAQTLAKAQQIYQRFHKPDHDCFGDILMAKGELASRRKEPETALGFYQKALAIYAAKFNNHHWKVKYAAEKSASVS